MYGCDDQLLKVMATHGEECTLIDRNGQAVLNGHLKMVRARETVLGEEVEITIVGQAGAKLVKWSRRRADR